MMGSAALGVVLFFFQAEDGIRDGTVTGVQTCALPIWKLEREGSIDLSGTVYYRQVAETGFVSGSSTHADRLATIRRIWKDHGRSEERRVGKECRSGWAADH